MAFWTTWIFLLPIIFNGQESKAQDCGVAPLNTKIVGGAGAAAGSWPWQVSMHYNPAASHICGGTLISDQWVLTATHCMISLSDWTLYMGRQTQIGSNPNEVTRSVSQIIVHPDYNNTFLNNDIALMKLSSPVSFTSYIRPICLAGNSSLFHSATSCWATGWGNIGKDVPLGSPQTLQEVEVPVVGNNQCSCQYILVEGANITDNMICAGRENKGACQGDSGGPVQCKQGSVWIQAGITSFGIPCALANFSEVYARVSQFQTWITDHVAGANVGFRTFTSSGTDQDNSFVCRNTDSGTATTAATTTASSAADCGVAPQSTKIVGGVGAAAGSWPWQVSVHYNPAASHICGGTLISDQWVLTATHCMISLRLSDWTLYMGRQTQIGSNPNEVTRSVSQIIVHPDYNSTFLNNDIALMKLSSPVSFTSYIRPICLAGNSSLFHSATSCWATGWGNIGYNVPLRFPQTLQEVEVPVVGNNQCSCQYILSEAPNITDNMICAGRKNKGVCQGDSGGPLQCKQGSVWIQAGIASFGIPCARANFPEVYARVSQFQTWITDHVTGANVDFRTFSSFGADQDNSFVCRNTAASSSAAGVGLLLSLFALILTMFL
uniref:transmembrane protease serine 9 n=1 Tax=Centroberyx gerrardi TaxID=166262 RepID=UPI003AAF6F74